MLSNVLKAPDTHPLHLRFGQKHMSRSETRLSVIVGVCQKDPKRWREFDSIYRPILRAFLRKQGLKEAQANDLVQEIFVKLLVKIHTYDRTKSSFRSWLFTIAQRTLIDQVRRRASYERAVDGWALQAVQATPSDSARMKREWTKIHQEKVLEHAIVKVRARTSPKVWACFEQRILRNRPAAEIAVELKVELNNVYVNASRVLKQVRAVCHEFDEEISYAFEPDLSRRS
jgi:RNA polymerase sigma-70 factor, ECF subfamily